MPILYERYITNDDTGHLVWTSGWYAQTFTPSISHTITSVKLLLYRVGSPGTITVSIRATTSDLPSGSDLAVGTTNGNTLTTNTAGEWREITLGAGTDLSSSIKYAIVARGPAGASAGNYVVWRADGSSPTYNEGAHCNSGDSGSSWAESVSTDFMFEEWGDFSGGGTVTTQECTDTTARTSTGHGLYTTEGDSSVTQHGHVWDTSASPTTANNKTENGAAPNLGQFSSNLTNLAPNTLYYVAAYVTNTEGTAYGSDVTITTGTTIGKRYIWTEGTDFHYFDAYGTERVLQGHAVASDKDILPWLDPWS